jgi:sulfofructose kinase
VSDPYVVCVGLATLDTVLAVPRHPGPDDRVWASDLVVAGGGPAATAAVTLARLGVRTFFVGAVGDDDTGAEIREGLAREGVDVSLLEMKSGARSPRSVVLVGAQGRSIAAFTGTARLELDDDSRKLCRGASWVHVDQTGYAPASRLRDDVRLSIDGGNPIEGLDVRGVALYGPTETALRDAFGSADRALDAGALLVVVTRGADGSTAYTADGVVLDAPAVPVDAVSTLGAGDVFHGALLARLVQDAPLRDALAFANECAALSCRGLDGRSAIPTAAELAA